jgi:O-antigen/teichoic acid export membrane protein
LSAAVVPPAGEVGSVTRRTARNAAVSAAAQVAGKVATLAWTVLAARVLGAGDFGAFFFALTLAYLLSSVAEWGFDAVMVQRASRDLSQLDVLLARAVGWQTLIAVPLFVVGGIVTGISRPSTSARVTLALVLLAVLLDIWSDSSRAASAAAQDQAGTARALVVQRTATMLLAVVALVAGGGVITLAAAFLVGSAVGVVAHVRAVQRLGVHLRPRAALARAPMLDFLHDTWVLGLTALVLMSLFRLDTILLGAIKGDEAVGGYVAAYRLLETVLFVAFSLRAAMFPVINATDAPERARRGVETALAALGFVYLPFGAVCLVEARPLLSLLYGDDYTGATGALQWLALAPLAYGIAYLGNSALQARRQQRDMLVAAVVAVVVNVVLNVALIPTYGGTAAGFTTTLSYLIESLLVVLALRRGGLSASVVRPFLESLVATAALAGVLLVLPFPLLVEVPIAAVVFLGVWFGLARRFSPEQITVLHGVVRRGAAA